MVAWYGDDMAPSFQESLLILTEQNYFELHGGGEEVRQREPADGLRGKI